MAMGMAGSNFTVYVRVFAFVNSMDCNIAQGWKVRMERFDGGHMIVAG